MQHENHIKVLVKQEKMVEHWLSQTITFHNFLQDICSPFGCQWMSLYDMFSILAQSIGHKRTQCESEGYFIAFSLQSSSIHMTFHTAPVPH